MAKRMIRHCENCGRDSQAEKLRNEYVRRHGDLR